MSGLAKKGSQLFFKMPHDSSIILLTLGFRQVAISETKSQLKNPKDGCSNNFSIFFFFLVFLGLYPQHVEVPRLGVKSELQLPAHIAATAMLDL